MGRTATQRLTDAALVGVCLGRAPNLPEDAASNDDFVAGARYHRIAPLANVALRESRPDVAVRLQQDRDKALLNHLRVSALLAGISRILEGIEWLVFKGPVLSEFAHPVPGLRFYKDLDLLVAPQNFGAACRRLLAADWQVLVGDDSLTSKEFPGEIPLVDKHGIVMDLHWAMIVMKSVRRRFTVDADSLLGRRVPVTIGPASLSILDPADALVHVCHHAALVGATKLGHVLDADQLARQVIDWDVLAIRARQWGATPQVAAVLSRAHRLFDTPVPGDLFAMLGIGPGLGRSIVLADRRWPIESLRHDQSWIRLITRALRPGLPGTAGAVVQRAGHGVLDRVRRTPSKERSMPDARVIEAYLRQVESMGAPGIR